MARPAGSTQDDAELFDNGSKHSDGGGGYHETKSPHSMKLHGERHTNLRSLSAVSALEITRPSTPGQRHIQPAWSAGSAAPSQSMYLLSLPTETIYYILKYTITPTDPIRIGHTLELELQHAPPVCQVANRLLHTIAMDVFYDQSIFALDLDFFVELAGQFSSVWGKKGRGSRSQLEPSKQGRLIRAIVLNASRYDNWTDLTYCFGVFPNLKTLLLDGRNPETGICLGGLQLRCCSQPKLGQFTTYVSEDIKDAIEATNGEFGKKLRKVFLIITDDAKHVPGWLENKILHRLTGRRFGAFGSLTF